MFGIEAGKDEVSLLTCTPYGVNTRRLVVTGERVDIPDPAPAPDDVPLARPGWWLLAAVGVAMALTGAMVLAAVPAGLAAAAAPAYVSAALSKVADGTGHGTPNQTFVNAANGFEVGDNAPDDGVVSSGDLVLYRLDLGFTAASARSVRVRWDLADAPYLEGGTEFCYSGAQVTASVQDDGSCVFTVPAGVAESVSRQIVLRGRDTGARGAAGAAGRCRRAAAPQIDRGCRPGVGVCGETRTTPHAGPFRPAGAVTAVSHRAHIVGVMPTFTREEIMHLGDLARIALTDEEIARLQGELNVIADAINKVQEVAGDDVPPTANPVPLEAYLRPDEAETPLTQEEAVSGAPVSEAGMFVAPRILGEE